ncbi:oligosaccharide flippase family protein [bacterium]|nr:oligosaccharide flippase family protein [bacterium]
MSRQHIVKSVFWLTIAEIIFNISGYIVHSGVGRILGPADYGRYGLVVTLTTMIIILIGNGIPTAMSKYLSEFFETRPDMIKVIKRQSLILQSILISAVTLIFFALAPLISRALDDSSLTPLFRISALIIPAFAAASFYFYYFTGIHRFNIQAVLKTVRSAAKVIFIIGLAYFFKVEGAVAGYIVAPFLVFLIAFGIDEFHILPIWKKWIKEDSKHSNYLKTSQNTQAKNPSPALLLKREENKSFSYKKLINYAWPLTLFLLFYEIMISIDLYMVKGLLHNDYLTGIYNGALTVGRVPYYLFYALAIVLLPTISKTTSQNKLKETKKAVSQSLRLMLLLLPPIIILMSAFSIPIIKLFYGAPYSASAFPMSILTVGVGFLTVFYIMSFAVNGAGKVKIPMWIAFSGAMLNILLNYFLIKNYALTGAAIATSLSSLTIMVIMLYFIKKYFKILIDFKSLFKIILASVIMYYTSFLFPKTENLIFIIWALILLAIYFIILYILREINSEDIRIFKKLISKK